MYEYDDNGEAIGHFRQRAQRPGISRNLQAILVAVAGLALVALILCGCAPCQSATTVPEVPVTVEPIHGGSVLDMCAELTEPTQLADCLKIANQIIADGGK